MENYLKPKQQPYNDQDFAENTLREKCPYSELFWSVFTRIRTEYVFSPNAGKCGPESRITPNTDTFYAVINT